MDDALKVDSKDTENYKCPGCGANMVFDPEVQALRCPYCENKEEIVNENKEIMEYDFETAEDNALINWGAEKQVLQCKTCGAEVVLDVVETANSCTFCGSSYIVKNDKTAGIVPESLVPFKISQKTAAEKFSKWIRKRYFAPRALKTNYKCEKISGVYIPNWTYDSNTYSSYTAEAGTYYYVTETYVENGQKKTRQVRKTRWRFTSGNFSSYFDDVLVNASKKADEGLMNRLEPFHLNELVPYSPRYLSGFIAERYSIGLKEGWNKAKSFIDSRIRSGVIRQINADEVRNLNIRTRYADIKYKHILLPIWISAYTYKNKVYRYMVNGQTGELHGHAPVSVVKIALLVAAIMLLCILGYYIYRYYNGNI